ncbi:MAG: hypothetical protein WCO81_02705 [Cyanobacteriota bacterium ELA615]
MYKTCISIENLNGVNQFTNLSDLEAKKITGGKFNFDFGNILGLSWRTTVIKNQVIQNKTLTGFIIKYR